MEEPIELSNGNVTCHQCRNTYQRIGAHWSQGSCSYPSIPNEKWTHLTGMMLGDATLRTQTNHPFVQIYMTNKPFMEWLDEKMGWLTTGVSLYRTADRSAELSRNNGSSPEAKASDYHDVYVMQTRSVPRFSEFESWYADADSTAGRNTKNFPDDIILNRRSARLWYACDGSLVFDKRYPGARPHVNISIGSEMHNVDNIYRMFEESTFEHRPRIDNHTLRFSVDETQDFLDWMGDAPPGFEYKWQTDYGEYKSEREAVMAASAVDDT